MRTPKTNSPQILGVKHPGTRIKAEVIPLGVSVTAAAKLMGVGRPALSNLLNGNAALSAEMATRIEKAFNVPRKELLEMQSKYDAALASEKKAPAETKTYVPPFLNIKANDVEQWAAHNISARTRLAVLLRTLIHSTGRKLEKTDFPGNDDGERPGWDGEIDANEATPWIPQGKSGWEFGTNEDVKKKADKDFSKSCAAIGPEQRKEITFVFVTPRRWPGKTAWSKAARAKGLWKDVHAYDSSDIEQWLEQSLPAQVWFANETCKPSQDVRSLDKCWSDWASVSSPPLTGALFKPALEASKRTMISRLAKPCDGPTVIVADSTEEALAFLSQLFGKYGSDDLISYRDRVLTFDKPDVLPRLIQGAPSFIPVVYSRAVERELGPCAKSMHSIAVYPRNSAGIEPHIILETLNSEPFNEALEQMGKNRDEISRLANESGRSLTVLRRRLASVPAVQKPEWAEDDRNAASLIPLLFVGAWRDDYEADKIGLSSLAGGRPYVELEKECQRLVQLNDSPIWSIGTCRGVISKLDLLYAIGGFITSDDLRRYFAMARRALGEDDPALDLEESRRWAAAMYGKTRKFSEAFRNGISETLVLLAIHGKPLFEKRLGIDPEEEARRVVRDLLPTPLTLRILEANDHDLPTYAEAAPDEFLSILESDLSTPDPAILGLLRPVNPGAFFSSPSRTGLLWALEGLAWSPETLPRAAIILARLAQVEIKDNWTNKPAHSLGSIMRAWMPQTAASQEIRVDLMKKLAARFPDVIWKICVAQFDGSDTIGDYSHKPTWRPDGYGYGEPFPIVGPGLKFQLEMVELALSWKEQSLETLSDLVESLPFLGEDYQNRIWDLIDSWSKNKASDTEKAKLRDKIRITTLSRRARVRAKKREGVAILSNKAKAVYETLESSDPLVKHSWLFIRRWVEESANELQEIEKLDYQEREERLTKMRIQAMREIREQHQFSGLLSLSVSGETAWDIGWLSAGNLLSEAELLEFLQLAFQHMLKDDDHASSYKNLISGALLNIPEDKCERILKAMSPNLPKKKAFRLWILAPFRQNIWRQVDTLDKETQSQYWLNVSPYFRSSDEDTHEGIERLLKAERPRAAFASLHFQSKPIDPQLLFRLLSEVATTRGKDREGEFLLNSFNVGEAFKLLNQSSVVTLAQKSNLEFAFLDVLSDRHSSGYGIPNLEQYIESHPELFINAVVWTYKRADKGTDPTEYQVPLENRENTARRGYKLLDAISRIPGHGEFGELNADRLAKWLGTVRKSCAELSRSEIGDICLGKLLSQAPVGKDDIWPCEPVRQVMEEIQSEDLMTGAQTGAYNSRGVGFRGEGGNQERELADKYRKWGKALEISHPFVASKLLKALANTYEQEASSEDTRAGVRRRFR